MASTAQTQLKVLATWLLISSYVLRQTDSITSLYDPSEDKVAELFEDQYQQGNSTTFYWHAPKLDKEWRSLSQSGIWIYYSGENYTGDNVTAVFGEDAAINIFHPVRSIRYASNSRSTTLPAAVLYKETWFRGTEHYIEVEDAGDLVMVPNFRDMGLDAQSMILVGSQWTIFPKQNFDYSNSSCWCLRPTHFDVTSDYYKEIVMASFYPNLTQIGTVGSLMLTCKGVPMKKNCQSLEEEDTNRSRCPILTNGRVEYC